MIRSLVIGICEELNQLVLLGAYLMLVQMWCSTPGKSQNLPQSKILSFEPDPNNFELLQMTHEASGLKILNCIRLL